jgi:hypothetical protein
MCEKISLKPYCPATHLLKVRTGCSVAEYSHGEYGEGQKYSIGSVLDSFLIHRSHDFRVNGEPGDTNHPHPGLAWFDGAIKLLAGAASAFGSRRDSVEATDCFPCALSSLWIHCAHWGSTASFADAS